MSSLTTKRGVVEFLVQQERAAERQLLRAVAATPEGEQAAALFPEVLGKRRKTATRQPEQLLERGALPSPSRGFGKQAVTPAPKPLPTSTVVAGALPKAVRDEIGAVLAETTKGGRFDRLLDALGRPAVDEWAALLQRAVKLGAKQGERFGGQVATVSGWMLERIRKASPAFVASRQKAADVLAACNKHMKLEGDTAFRGVHWVEHVTDGDDKLLTDGIRVATNAKGRVLVLMIDELKLESVAGDVRKQFDAVIERIRTRGMVLDGSPVPPERIDLPVATTRESWNTELVAYLEHATARPMVTTGGYKLTVVGIDSREIRDFIEVFLTEWRKRMAATAK